LLLLHGARAGGWLAARVSPAASADAARPGARNSRGDQRQWIQGHDGGDTLMAAAAIVLGGAQRESFLCA